MFNIGWSEILVIFIVGCCVIDPKELPGLISNFKRYYSSFMQYKTRMSNIVDNVIDEIEVQADQVAEPVKKFVIGEDGKSYEAYDVKSVLKHDSKDTSS